MLVRVDLREPVVRPDSPFSADRFEAFSDFTFEWSGDWLWIGHRETAARIRVHATQVKVELYRPEETDPS